MINDTCLFCLTEFCSMIIVSHTVPKSSCSLRFLRICLGEWWSHVMEDLPRLVWILQIRFFKGLSLLFSENVAPSSQPKSKDFTMPSSATCVRCYLRASVNCISCSIWMCPTTAWWRCPKSWISAWKLQNHLGLGFGAYVCVLVWEPKSEEFQN